MHYGSRQLHATLGRRTECRVAGLGARAAEQNRVNQKGHSGGTPECEPTAEQRKIVSRVSRATHCLSWSAIALASGA
jgi:hypothetical protein